MNHPCVVPTISSQIKNLIKLDFKNPINLESSVVCESRSVEVKQRIPLESRTRLSEDAAVRCVFDPIATDRDMAACGVQPNPCVAWGPQNPLESTVLALL